jgi:hypothetical protein
VADTPEYEPINIPRPVWWLLLAAICILFAMLFLFAMFTYSVNPATECDPSADGLKCQEIPGAPVVFATAAGIAAIVAGAALVVFGLTGGLATLPWVGEQVSHSWSFIRSRVRPW